MQAPDILQQLSNLTIALLHTQITDQNRFPDDISQDTRQMAISL